MSKPQRAPSGDLHTLSYSDLQVLSDRLFSCGISSLSAIGPKERADMIEGSRAIRALLRHIELKTGRQLQTVLLAGRV
jgi:hypothetical protein